MLLQTVAPAIASAFIFTLAGNCARNMLQTAEVRKLAIANDSTCSIEPISNPLDGNEGSIADCLKTMNRKELLQVFANGRAPTPSELSEWFSCNDDEYCEWDGALLDNNGIIMTQVSNFMTHQLFGGALLPWRLASRAKGRWKGKAFAKPTTLTAGEGFNQFSGSDTNKNSLLFLRHKVDYDVMNSGVLNGEDNPALRLDYWRYQSLPISLWWAMHDELRVVDSPQSSEVVMIGMGWMGWSGGALNCSPFMLERPRK